MDRKKERETPQSLMQKGPGGNEPTTHPDYAAHVNVGSSGIREPAPSTSSATGKKKKKPGKPAK